MIYVPTDLLSSEKYRKNKICTLMLSDNAMVGCERREVCSCSFFFFSRKSEIKILSKLFR